MATIPYPNSQVSPRNAVVVCSGLLLLNLGIILFIQNETLRIALNDLVSPVVGLLSAAMLFYAAWKLRSTSTRFALAWCFLAIGCLAWALGDVYWAVLELFLQEQPFPSMADFFYLAYYPLVIIGFLIMPFERFRRRERVTTWLDLGVVFLASGLLYWNFLIGPVASFEESDPLTFLISIAYPVFDLVLFAALMLLLYRKHTLLGLRALFFLASSIIIQIIFDTIYGLQSISGTYVSGTILDISWQVGFVTFGLAGIFQLQTSAQTDQRDLPEKESVVRRQMSSLLAFLPYLWLAAAYLLLIYAEYTPLPMSYEAISIVIGIIIALILTRQVLAISETTRLSDQLKLELVERQRAQELLRKSHDELEERVRLRTIDLTSANEQLEREIDERMRTEAQLKSALEEKEVLLKEIHHRVKNNLQVISSMLTLQTAQVKDASLTAALIDSQNRVQSMALIHEKLYQSTNLAYIDFAGYLESLVSYLYCSYYSSEKQVNVHLDADPVTLEIGTAVPCGLIVNELVSNALKHAFPDRPDGEIVIQLKQSGNCRVRLAIYDDGVGIPESIEILNSPSLGLQLVNALVGQLDGDLEFERNQGTKFTISFSPTQTRTGTQPLNP